ncbi:hypothetical protein P3X46_019785 [Hevea brasiliensis]|uniref:Uncharacterized protein n=1 Tax=Hevea brasiliensis TaxID=3981 RepID=A0ABQ9LMW3_HEVBR|nr:uncharacterized protein LOC110645330 [Hevea brasiliensis]KAJ9168235.1 hypothetical protein P3X46_019785 [Hevea brasiliensis]
MADKPSRALVLYGDGLAQFVDPSHTHIHSLASKAACGFLSLPNAPPSESEDERIVREFANLLDACEAYQDMSFEKSTLMPTISQRFMGMKAAVVTNSPYLKSFGSKIGFNVLQFSDLNGNDGSLFGTSVDLVTSELLKLLGFQEGQTIETSQFDFVLVHIGAGERVNSERGSDVISDTEYINALVGGVMNTAQPGSEIGSRLHLSLVMSYGNYGEMGTNLSILASKDEMNSDLSMLLPRQSYTMKGEKPRTDVRHHCPMLIAQWQYAVTRMDMAETFSFKDFKKHGGNGVIPADRFMHEVAFKLWKAPKYGA